MDARSRSFNLLRAKVLSIRRERNWRMIGLVSATPNVGKSFISANLAAAISRDPRLQTYLIDLDLRRGAIRDIFGLSTETGIADFLAEKGPGGVVPAFRPKGQELIIIPNVPGHVRSADLLAGERANSLLRAMRNSDSKNFFIFDLPPVFADDDAATSMELLDSYILVAEEGRTTQSEVEAAVEMLGIERLAGVVLNKYRGGLISEGRGIEERYGSGYYAGEIKTDVA
jgi:Mrp family chromosome partitioning ATPase